MSDKLREQFEAAYKDACLKRPIPRFDAAVFAKDHCGDYLNPLVQSAWWAWKESRASLVIELPDDGIEDCQKEWPERGAKYKYDTFDTGYLFACMKHEQAIEAAGLKVTP